MIFGDAQTNCDARHGSESGNAVGTWKNSGGLGAILQHWKLTATF